VIEAVLYAETEPPRVPEAAPAPGEQSVAGSGVDPADALLQMVNHARQTERLPPLLRDGTLDRLAQQHAESMRHNARLAHDLGHGNPKQRVAAAGLRVREAGENVARATSIKRAHRVVWASPSHRVNLLYARFESIGIGIAEDVDGAVWVCELLAQLEP
jgi:uncharacterized protein YkwD